MRLLQDSLCDYSIFRATTSMPLQRLEETFLLLHSAQVKVEMQHYVNCGDEQRHPDPELR
jgi:hypothetical protein